MLFLLATHCSTNNFLQLVVTGATAQYIAQRNLRVAEEADLRKNQHKNSDQEGELSDVRQIITSENTNFQMSVSVKGTNDNQRSM